MTDKIRKRLKKRNRLWKKYCDNPNYIKLNNYKQERNSLNADITRAKRNFEVRIAESVKDSNKAFYAYVNSKRVSRERIGPLKGDDGKIISDSEGMGNMLNTYFKSVFTKENTNYVPTASKEAKGGRVLMMEEIGITSDKIVQAIDSLKNNKAAGIDEINTTMLKRTCKSIVEPLTLIYEDYH